MAFPEEDNQKNKEGSYHFNPEDNKWHCEKCDHVSDIYQSIVGHQGKHSDRPPQVRKGGKAVGRAGNMRGKDPMNMTIQELVDTIAELREALKKSEVEGADAIARWTKMQSLFSSVIEPE